MSFLAIEIQQTPGFTFQGGPEFSTNVQNTQSGGENRNADWENCRHRYTAPYHNITNESYLAVKDVFLMCRAKRHSFLLKDWGDYLADGAKFAVGDGTTTAFQLKKISTVVGTSVTYERSVYKLLAETIYVYADGVEVFPAVDPNTGQVVFGVAPEEGVVLTWTGEFRVQVRFDTDYLPFTIDDKSGNSFILNGSLDLIEVLNELEDAT